MDKKYRLRCLGGGEVVEDRYTVACPSGHRALLRTEYRNARLTIRQNLGLFRFHDWLPVEGVLRTDGGPVTFQSEALAGEIGLRNLFVGFSGYWPERSAFCKTCSFKELEAAPTMLRMKEKGTGVLVVASAGNTGRAFSQVSAQTGIPVVVVVPEKSVPRIWTTEKTHDVLLIAVKGDYSDAITFSQEVVRMEHLVPEGGTGNVARRDGMGTVMLDATIASGRIPAHYFQAIGSGAGAIAAWEASIRLRGDGRFGSHLPCLHLCQNFPFVPMVSAWNAGREEIDPALDMPDARSAIAQVYADVLTNRNPPYAIRGGVYDALMNTKGKMYSISNDDAMQAGKLFMELEGIDLDPAAAVCTASLIQAVGEGHLNPDEMILLNITGGGYLRAREDLSLYPVPVGLVVSMDEGIEPVKRDMVSWVHNHA
jgi:cysteate synthase